MMGESFQRQLEANRKAYVALQERLQREYAGSYVAIAGGRLIGAGDSYDAAMAAVKALSPHPQHYIVFMADSEPVFDIVDDLIG